MRCAYPGYIRLHRLQCPCSLHWPYLRFSEQQANASMGCANGQWNPREDPRCLDPVQMSLIKLMGVVIDVVFLFIFTLILIFVYFAGAPNEADVSGAMAHIRGISMALSDSFATTRFSYVDMVLSLHCTGSPLKSMGLEEIYLMWFDSGQMVDMILYMNHMIWNLLDLLTLYGIYLLNHMIWISQCSQCCAFPCISYYIQYAYHYIHYTTHIWIFTIIWTYLDIFGLFGQSSIMHSTHRWIKMVYTNQEWQFAIRIVNVVAWQF